MSWKFIGQKANIEISNWIECHKTLIDRAIKINPALIVAMSLIVHSIIV